MTVSVFLLVQSLVQNYPSLHLPGVHIQNLFGFIGNRRLGRYGGIGRAKPARYPYFFPSPANPSEPSFNKKGIPIDR